MNLGEMRAQVLENVGIGFGSVPVQVDRLINRSLEHVVNLVEASAKFYNECTSPITVSVNTTDLSYILTPSGTDAGKGIRKILYAERTDTGAGTHTPCAIIDHRHRTKYSEATVWGNSAVSTTRPVIFFKRLSSGAWYLCLPVASGSTMTIQVYHAPTVAVLASDSDIPTEVPTEHHDLIVLRATMFLLENKGKAVDFYERRYAESLSLMSAGLESWNRTGPRIRHIDYRNV